MIWTNVPSSLASCVPMSVLTQQAAIAVTVMMDLIYSLMGGHAVRAVRN